MRNDELQRDLHTQLGSPSSNVNIKNNTILIGYLLRLSSWSFCTSALDFTSPDHLGLTCTKLLGNK